MRQRLEAILVAVFAAVLEPPTQASAGRVVVGAVFLGLAAALAAGIPSEVVVRTAEHLASEPPFPASLASVPADTLHNPEGTVETPVDRLAFASAFALPSPAAVVASRVPVQPTFLRAFREMPLPFPQP